MTNSHKTGAFDVREIAGVMCFKFYHVMQIIAVESVFDCPNFNLVLLTIHFELWLVNRGDKLT